VNVPDVIRTGLAYLAARITTLRRPTGDDRGAETIQTVIITAGLALLALLVVAAIKGGVGKFIVTINNLGGVRGCPTTGARRRCSWPSSPRRS
jgi:hypothetical protein